jgi:hypothetical protein
LLRVREPWIEDARGKREAVFALTFQPGVVAAMLELVTEALGSAPGDPADFSTFGSDRRVAARASDWPGQAGEVFIAYKQILLLVI